MLACLTSRRLAASLAVLLAVLAASLSSSAAPAISASKPTVVIVHGAFADASGWKRVIERLQRQGYTVIAPANPLRGMASDAAYIRSFLAKSIASWYLVAGRDNAIGSGSSASWPNASALTRSRSRAPHTP